MKTCVTCDKWDPNAGTMPCFGVCSEGHRAEGAAKILITSYGHEDNHAVLQTHETFGCVLHWQNPNSEAERTAPNQDGVPK